MSRFQGKSVLITGAGRGIGRALALGFANEGATTLLCSRTRSEVDAVAAEIRAAGGRAWARACDASSSAQVAAFVAEAVKEHGLIDVLINNAGILGPRAPLAEISDVEWKAVLAANLDSAFYMARAALTASMLARGRGCVINVSSGQGRKASAGWGPYAASKFALEGLTQAWADECRDRGVRFYTLNPGPTRTAMRAQAAVGEDPASVKPPEAVVEAFLTLASDDCRVPTGSSVSLNRATGKLLEQ